VTVAFNNLAVGVGVGVVIAMALFARRVAHLVEISSSLDENGLTRTYAITGALFFASDRHLVDAFDYTHDPPHIIIDLTHAHIWDASAVAALDTITHRYATHGTAVHITGANHHSQTLHDTLTGQLRGAH
jgi:SulP family sulfate permease